MQFPKELFESPIKAEQAIAAAQKFDSSIADPDQVMQAARHHPELTEALRGILTPRHPSQLYEAFFEGVVLFAILWFVRTRMRQPNGVLTGLFFILYAIFRISVENVREPDAKLIVGVALVQVVFFFRIALRPE